MHDMVTADHGPKFHGFRGLIDGRLVCVIPLKALHEESERGIVRRLMRRQGADCDRCRGCIIGRHQDN